MDRGYGLLDEKSFPHSYNQQQNHHQIEYLDVYTTSKTKTLENIYDENSEEIKKILDTVRQRTALVPSIIDIDIQPCDRDTLHMNVVVENWELEKSRNIINHIESLPQQFLTTSHEVTSIARPFFATSKSSSNEDRVENTLTHMEYKSLKKVSDIDEGGQFRRHKDINHIESCEDRVKNAVTYLEYKRAKTMAESLKKKASDEKQINNDTLINRKHTGASVPPILEVPPTKRKRPSSEDMLKKLVSVQTPSLSPIRSKSSVSVTSTSVKHDEAASKTNTSKGKSSKKSTTSMNTSKGKSSKTSPSSMKTAPTTNPFTAKTPTTESFSLKLKKTVPFKQKNSSHTLKPSPDPSRDSQKVETDTKTSSATNKKESDNESDESINFSLVFPISMKDGIIVLLSMVGGSVVKENANNDILCSVPDINRFNSLSSILKMEGEVITITM